MFGWACLDRAPAAAQQLLLSDGVLALSAALTLIAAASAAVAMPFVQQAYRRRVLRLMRFDQVAPRPAAWWGLHAPAQARRVRPAGASADADRGAQRVAQQERRTATSTALAWLAFVIAALPVAHWVLPQQAAADKAAFVAGAGLLALGALGINLPRRLALRLVLPALAVGAVALGLALVFADADPAAATPANDADEPGVVELTIYVLLIGLAYWAMLHHSLRGLMIPLWVATAVMLLLWFIPLAYLEPHLGACVTEHLAAASASPADRPATLGLLSLIAAMGVLAIWLALKALDALARLVEAGWLSELSLCVVVVLVMSAVMMVGFSLVDQPGHSPWVAWLPLPWVALPAAVYAGFNARGGGDEPGPRLLVLRVFARDRRQLKLVDTLQSRWRYVGPVHQIGGPDLATRNVDPYECALFLSGRLHDAFLPEAASAEQLSARLDFAADREGRYRISEVFCFNSAWRATVEQLMQMSDAILLDLRGFNAQREGTGYELRVLAHADLIERVVAIGDASTDWSHVERLLRAEGGDSRRLARRDVGTADPAPAIFDQLLAVAARAPGGSPSTARAC